MDHVWESLNDWLGTYLHAFSDDWKRNSDRLHYKRYSDSCYFADVQAICKAMNAVADLSGCPKMTAAATIKYELYKDGGETSGANEL